VIGDAAEHFAQVSFGTETVELVSTSVKGEIA
jgi:hypothetical protein